MPKKKSGEEYFAKHPLAAMVMKKVEAWASANYPAENGREITPTTRALLEYWFNEDIHEDYRFHICQRRAIEAAVYCFELLDLPLPKDLFEFFDKEELKKEGLVVELEKTEFPRYAIKMATGTGKTWVINALVVWQYFNRLRHKDGRFTSHFLLMAPGIIVFDRLLDSFMGRMQKGKRNKMTADLSKELFMPKDWAGDFNLRVYTKEDITGNTQPVEEPFIMITNWHQLLDTDERERSYSEELGIEFKEESDSYRVQNFYEFLSANPDLTVINDEAHHLHSASDKDLKRWQESLEKLYGMVSAHENSVFCQFDFTATPYTPKSKKKEWMKHVIYDYGLVEAMRDMLVKQIFIERSSYLSEKIEKMSENENYKVTGYRDEARKLVALSEIQKHMLEVGYEKLKQLEEDFKKLHIPKKPVMFVVADNKEEADEISTHLKQKSSDPEGKQIATIHIGKKDSLSDEDYALLKEKVFRSDDYDSEIRIIVSVMMLREGFDVRNVCVLVVLRPSDSPLLTEQVLGRGIRLMFTEGEYQEQKMLNMEKLKKNEQLINSYDFLFVVEHPQFNQIYNDLKNAGATLATGESKKLTLDSKRAIIEVDPTRIEKLDLQWPLSSRDTSVENIDFSYFDLTALPQCPVPFDQMQEKSVIITDFHPETRFMQDWLLKDEVFTYTNFLRTATLDVIGGNRNMSWLSRYFDQVAQIIDEYTSEILFGRTIDFSIQENASKLKNYQLFEFVVTNARKEITAFVSKRKPVSVLKVTWAKLSDFKEIKVVLDRALETKRCIYPTLDFGSKGGFERRFAEFVLEKDSSIISYVKLDQYVHGFSIPYADSKGYIGKYYPDFLVKTANTMYLLETKSEKDAYNDINVKAKMKAAQQFCRSISNASNPLETQPKAWVYVLIPENVADDLEGHSFKTVIEMAEAFMNNLLWSGTRVETKSKHESKKR